MYSYQIYYIIVNEYIIPQKVLFDYRPFVHFFHTEIMFFYLGDAILIS